MVGHPDCEKFGRNILIRFSSILNQLLWSCKTLVSSLCIRMILTSLRILLALTSERQLRKTVNLWKVVEMTVMLLTPILVHIQFHSASPSDMLRRNAVSFFLLRWRASATAKDSGLQSSSSSSKQCSLRQETQISLGSTRIRSCRSVCASVHLPW